MNIPILSAPEFFERTVGGRPNQMKITPYIGKPFACGCGETHNLGSNTQILREFPGMKLVIQASQCNFVNCIKIQGLFKVRLETLFSTAI